MPAKRSWQSLTSRMRDQHTSSQEGNGVAGIADVIELGDLRLELDSMRVFVCGREQAFTAQEFDMLLLLAIDEGRTIAHGRLSWSIWQDDAPHHNRHLSVLMARLRAKLAGS